MRAPILDIDGEIGAEQGAESAVDAFGVINEFGRMVAFRIGALGHDQHTLGAELDTEAASLASFLNDVDNAVRHLDAVSIQGLSPVGHCFFLFLSSTLNLCGT
jgi:hypothetical protein